MRTRPSRPAAFAVGLIALLAAGCGDRKVTLTGTVKAKGQPLPSGSLMVQCADGTTAAGAIVNGQYSVEGVTPGELKIALSDGVNTTPAGAMPDRGGMGGPQGRGAPPGGVPQMPVAPPAPSKIPPQMQKLDTTTLTHNTASGLVKDIDLP